MSEHSTPWMPEAWQTRALCSVADVAISSVDKKSHLGEQPVRLCNYLDVYNNLRLTGKISYMAATATITEIERFSLARGDVLITKDSETPDDIGVPAVVDDDLQGVVCGYHLAHIRPHEDKASGPFLAAALRSPGAIEYFRQNAHGSTRFGLPIAAIENIPLLLPPLPEQRKIAAILSSVDAVLEKTEALIAKLKDLKKAMMQELLTKGIGHTKFKDSPVGRIPEEWEVVRLGDVLAPTEDPMRSGPFGSALLKSELVDQGVPLLGIDNIHTEVFRPRFTRFVSDDKFSQLRKYAVADRDVVITIMGTIGRCCVLPPGTAPALSSKHIWTMTFDLRAYVPELICWQLNHADWVAAQIRKSAQGGVMDAINSGVLRNLLLPKPGRQEQDTIVGLYESMNRKIIGLSALASGHRTLKKALMQDLLTGKVRVNT